MPPAALMFRHSRAIPLCFLYQDFLGSPMERIERLPAVKPGSKPTLPLQCRDTLITSGRLSPLGEELPEANERIQGRQPFSIVPHRRTLQDYSVIASHRGQRSAVVPRSSPERSF